MKGGGTMPQIRPITDLRNTTEISDICHAKREPAQLQSVFSFFLPPKICLCWISDYAGIIRQPCKLRKAEFVICG